MKRRGAWMRLVVSDARAKRAEQAREQVWCGDCGMPYCTCACRVQVDERQLALPFGEHHAS